MICYPFQVCMGISFLLSILKFNKMFLAAQGEKKKCPKKKKVLTEANIKV